MLFEQLNAQHVFVGAFTMNSGNEYRTSQALPPVFFTSGQIPLPREIIIYLRKFLHFNDYRSFIQSLWPEGDGIDVFRVSTCKIEATFLNKKRLEIEYNFDSTRKKEDRVLVNLDNLLPVLGGTAISGMDKFISISKLNCAIDERVNFNMCSNRRHACCPCHLLYDSEESYEEFVKPSVDECENGHFHHYCWEHVTFWFQHYLNSLILYRESKELFDEEIASWLSSPFLDYWIQLETGKCGVSEFLLTTALDMF